MIIMKKIMSTLFILLSTHVFANVNYNVFVKMDNKATEVVEDISKNLNKHNITSLYDEKYQIHVTLYLSEYKKDAFEKIKDVVDDVATNAKPIELQFYNIRKTPGNWLMLDAKKAYDIQALADEVTARLLPLRATDAQVPNWAKSMPAKVRSFKTYGSPNVFSNFDPHVTLLTPKKAEDILAFQKEYNFKPFTSKITGIGIAEVDDLGQAKDILYFKEIK